MKKKLTTLFLACMSMVPVMAQNEEGKILIQKQDGKVDTLSLNIVLDIYHSPLGTDGEKHSDIATLRLRTLFGERVYPLTEIDHVVMPKQGRLVSFLGTANNKTTEGGPRRTSASGTFSGVVSDVVNYHWVNSDHIFLQDGRKSNNLSDGRFGFIGDDIIADEYTIYYAGQDATTKDVVIIPINQSQTSPDNSNHLGLSGDCGTAIAKRRITSSNITYDFALDHKTAVLVFLPRVDTLKTVRLKSIAVKATENTASGNPRTIAGQYLLSPSGVSLTSDGRDTITLTTQTGKDGKAGFLLPNIKANAQDSAASYMVVAPQSGKTYFKVYYRVEDTKSKIDTIVQKYVTINDIAPATFYPINHKIDPRIFLSAFTDSVRWDFDQPATLFGSVNLPVTKVGFLWGNTKDLTAPDALDVHDIPLNGTNLQFDSQILSSGGVKQKPYYFQAYALYGGQTYWGDIKKFGLEREIIYLGTSVAWSNINMGAVTADDYGDYYAWGETESKTSFTLSNYRSDLYDASTGKYLDVNSIVGNPQYDPATKYWRGCWRMPTRAEAAELAAKCNLEWSSRQNENGNTVYGLLVKNKNNNADSVIFIPSAGYYSGMTRNNFNSTGHNWTGTAPNTTQANDLHTGNRFANASESNAGTRYDGRTIRPVFDSNITISHDGRDDYLFLRTDSIHYINSGTYTLTEMYGTMRGLNDEVTDVTQGFVIGTTENVELTSSDRVVTLTKSTADDNGTYSLPLTDAQMNTLDLFTTYYVRSYLTYNGETRYANAVTMDAMSIATDSTNWQVPMTKARLCGTVTGITAAVKHSTEIGFVVGTTPDVTLHTAGHIKLRCDSTVNNKFVCEFDDIELKQYYYRAYVSQGGRVAYGEPKMLGLEMVDLGLPSGLLWANINIGSQTPMVRGDYFAWGSTTPGTPGHFYASDDPHNGQNIGTNIKGTVYDAAQVIWRGPWHMPTNDDVAELIANTTGEVTSLYGTNGVMLTSKINGKQVFIPYTGYYENNSNANNPIDIDRRFLLWTANLSDRNYGYYFDNVYDGNKLPRTTRWDWYRYTGMTIRPVARYNMTLPDDSHFLMTTDSVQWNVGSSQATLFGYLLGLRYNNDATESGFVVATTENVTAETSGVQFLKTNVGEVEKVTSGVMRATFNGVADGTVYYYRSYVKVGDTYYYGEEREFGRRLVDLGLTSGTLWANINVGASSPDVSGNFFAWGETAAKSDYSNSTYTYTGNDADISGSEHDAATQTWGGSYSMPSQADMQELLTECTWTQVVKYGQPMYKIVAADGRDSIFIAMRGYMNGTSLTRDGDNAALWTSTLNTVDGDDYSRAYGTTFRGYDRSVDAIARSLGYAVRPVVKWNAQYDDDDVASRFMLTNLGTNWQVGTENVELYGAVQGLDESLIQERGFIVGTNKLTPETTLKLAVDGTAPAGITKVVAPAPESETTSFVATITYSKDTTYYYRPYVKVNDGYYYGDQNETTRCRVRRYGLEFVDLGGGIKWASINIGAQTDAELGQRFAWGETTTKSLYNENNYTYYYSGNYQNIGADISGKSYDVATTLWPLEEGKWRMPTSEEMNWLLDNCTWTWTTVDEQQGYRVTSTTERDADNNLQSIFLPAAGYQEFSIPTTNGGLYYWTSTLYGGGLSEALHATSSSRAIDNVARYLGLSVRPVTTADSQTSTGGGITGGHNQGSGQQTGDDSGGGSGGAGSGDTGGTVTGD